MNSSLALGSTIDPSDIDDGEGVREAKYIKLRPDRTVKTDIKDEELCVKYHLREAKNICDFMWRQVEATAES